MVAIVILDEDVTTPTAPLTHLLKMRLSRHPLFTLLAMLLVVAPALAQPLVQQQGDGRTLYEQRRTDLRSALRGQNGEGGAQPAGPQWQLSPEDRAAMRQQISREGQRGNSRDDDRQGDRRR